MESRNRFSYLVLSGDNTAVDESISLQSEYFLNNTYTLNNDVIVRTSLGGTSLDLMALVVK